MALDRPCEVNAFGRWRAKTSLLLTALVLAGLLGCGQEEGAESSVASTEPDPAPVIFVTNYPLHYMNAELAGDAANVQFADVDGDPAFWQPTADVVAEMQQADLIVLNGAGYEPWLGQVTLPADRLLDTSAGFRDQWIESGGPTHSHGADGEHAHSGFAFTTWLDLEQAKAQATAIRDRLATLLPDADQEIEGNWTTLATKLDAWDKRLTELGARFGDTPVLFSHPVYQYMERRYGFNGRSLHWEPDSAPPDAEWAALPALLTEHPATLMIWEDEPLAETVEGLKALGVESVVFSPMGNRPATGDFESGMEGNLNSIEGAAPP